MAGFRKAKAEQAALKIAFYGGQGSGKTMTALMVAEYLAQLSGKRVAFNDTERGTDFYAQTIPDRLIHPEAFDFDVLHTKSITELLQAVRELDPREYGVFVSDSISHIWDACQLSWSGKRTKIGTIPISAWAQIKKPYKELMSLLLSSPMHVILCGREGNVFEENDDTGEMKKVGTKMRAEGETPYEPHILIHMVQERKPDGTFNILAMAEKDRSGVLTGKIFENPTAEMLVKPILPYLGKSQAQIQSPDEVAAIDAEQLAVNEVEREAQSTITLQEFTARLSLAKSKDDVDGIGKEITPKLKASMLPGHVAELREKFLEAKKRVGG